MDILAMMEREAAASATMAARAQAEAEEEAAVQNEAATIVQTQVRVVQAKKHKETEAATVVQSQVRVAQAKKEVVHKKAEHAEAVAAAARSQAVDTSIAPRGASTRHLGDGCADGAYYEEVEEEVVGADGTVTRRKVSRRVTAEVPEEAAAATVVQTRERSRKARKEVKAKREGLCAEGGGDEVDDEGEEGEEGRAAGARAAGAIQARWRGKQGRSAWSKQKMALKALQVSSRESHTLSRLLTPSSHLLPTCSHPSCTFLHLPPPVFGRRELAAGGRRAATSPRSRRRCCARWRACAAST